MGITRNNIKRSSQTEEGENHDNIPFVAMLLQVGNLCSEAYELILIVITKIT